LRLQNKLINQALVGEQQHTSSAARVKSRFIKNTQLTSQTTTTALQRKTILNFEESKLINYTSAPFKLIASM
jgi:hypothetical protein